MAKYRKIDPRIWNDMKFRQLSDNGKLVFFMLLTHPHMTAVGAMRATPRGLSAEIGWTEEAFEEAFKEAVSKGMVKVDLEASFIWIPNFIKFNQPESPNVVIAWVKAIDELPECSLFYELQQHIKAFLEGYNKAFCKALPKDFAQPSSNQEQEQEQEQEYIKPPTPFGKFDAENMELSKHIDRGEWSRWIRYLVEKFGKPPVESTAHVMQQELLKFKTQGFAVDEIITYSIGGGYSRLCKPNPETLNKNKSKVAKVF